MTMNFFRRIFDLCTGFTAYRAVADVSALASLGHLTLLLALCSTVVVGSYLPDVLRQIDGFADWWQKAMPTAEIRDGQLHADLKEPFTAGYRDWQVVLDPANGVTKPETNADAGILLGRDRALFWSVNRNHPDAPVFKLDTPMSDFPPGMVDAGYIRKWCRGGSWFGAPMAVGFITVGALLVIVLQAYLFSVVAALMDRSIGQGLLLKQYMNISLHAATPAVLVLTAYTMMRLDALMEHIGWVYIIVYGIFLIGGTNTVRRAAALGNDG
jgi:hypothetical protein